MVKIVFFLNTRKLSPLNTGHTEAGHLAFLCLKWILVFLSVYTYLWIFLQGGTEYITKSCTSSSGDEVCFRIRFLNPIIYPARASVNTLSTAKGLIDKYWNKIMLSCLTFPLTLHLGGGKNRKQKTAVKDPRDGYFYMQIKV